MPTETHTMQTLFVQHAAELAGVSDIAEMAVASWKDIGAALSPIIGQTGVAALFKRSIYLTRSAHACLAPVSADKSQPDELAALQAVLGQQARAIAVAANGALLQNFQDLLTSLIGLSLTERLLSPVWDKLSSDYADQDTVS